MTTEDLAGARTRTARALALVLLVVTVLGFISAIRFPVFDDEANAITNASVDLTEILSKGLGRYRQFHPPLGEMVLHSWLATTGSMRAAVVRIPAIAFWVAALASLFWALRPIASSAERLTAVTATALWPTHLLLPFSATWYSLAALLTVLSLGSLLRAFSASSPQRARVALAGMAAAMVALAYTVFAWPFVMAAELTSAVLIFGAAPLRRHGRAFVALVVVLILAISPTILALSARVGPMLHRQAGGGPTQSVGGLLGLVVGHSAPAEPWAICFAVLAIVGLVIGAAGADRRAWSVVSVGLISLGCLAATNTLNDKRLLLGSLFLPAGLGLRIGDRRGRVGLVLCAVAAIPAWLGWMGITRLPWLFPRWQDPIGVIVGLHASTPKPRLLVTNEPEIAFSVAALDGDHQLWQLPEDGPIKAASLRWRLWKPELLHDAVEKQDRYTGTPLRTIDIVISTKMKPRAIAIRDSFISAGWRVVDDRTFGADPLSQFRHPGAGSERFRLIRLDRGAATPSPMPSQPIP